MRLLDRVEILKRFPLLGRQITNKPAERVLVEALILIFYRFDADAGIVQIKRFWHGAREGSK